MKKVLVSALFVSGMFAFGAFAQNYNQMEAQARKALQDAGCLDGYNGSFIIGYRYEVTPLLDNCWSVTAYPVANPTIAPYVRLSAVGNVVICNGEVSSVSCE